MHLAILQYNIAWEDKKANFLKVQKLCRSFSKADLIVLPELFSTGYTMQPRPLAEDLVEGATFKFLGNLAKEHNAYILTSFIAKSANTNPKNTAVLLTPQGQLAFKYVKHHLMTITGESKAYTPGHTLTTMPYKNKQFGVCICYDLRFPELFLEFGRQRATCFICLANWPVQRISHWDTLLRARAIESQCFVIGVNRTGDSPTASYNGHSCVIAPDGSYIVSPEDTCDCVKQAFIDFSIQKQWRDQFPALKDKRLDLFPRV